VTLWGPALTLTTSARGHGDSDAMTSGPATSAVRSRMLCGWGVKAGMICYISRESKTTRNALWSRASVCLSMCLSAAACPYYCTDPDVTWGSGRGCPLVVHHWEDLQSVHGIRSYGNITEMRGRAQR